MTEREQELYHALDVLYELCREDSFGKGWKRGQNGMRIAALALGRKRVPPSPYEAVPKAMRDLETP